MMRESDKRVMARLWSAVLLFGSVAAPASLCAAEPPKATSSSNAAGAAADKLPALRKGEDLFTDYGCGGCHTLAKAGATGRVGPAFDGNANLSTDFVIDRVTNGQGMMPAFIGQMSPEEIAAVAKYVTESAAR